VSRRVASSGRGGVRFVGHDGANRASLDRGSILVVMVDYAR
jgi:hypothetical protein